MAAWSGVNSYTGQGSVSQFKDIKDSDKGYGRPWGNADI